MRLAIVTAIWRRPEVFKMFVEGVKVLRQQFHGRLEIIVCVAGSEGFFSKNIVTENKNFFYVDHPNFPLGRKMNAACNLARKFNPDYCLMLGSDDIVGPDLMEKYFEQMQRRTDYVYLKDCYFFDTQTKKGLYWGGYINRHNKGAAAGIGRLISNHLLNSIGWVCWPDGFDRILDTGFDKQVAKINFNKVGFNIKELGVFALDIKSNQNMTPFEKWENSEFVDGEKLLFRNLPEHLAALIYGKRPVGRQ